MRWESASGSRGTMIFVLTLIALEVLALLGTILVPGFFQDDLVRFILFGLIHLTFAAATLVFLILGLAKLRSKKIKALISFFTLVAVGFFLFAINLKAINIRLWIFYYTYTDIATRVINQEFPIKDSDHPLKNVTVPSNFFLVWKGQDATIQSAKIDGNSLVFFLHSGFGFTGCGYMFSSINKMPNISVFTFGDGARGGFNPIAPNWFYGCITY